MVPDTRVCEGRAELAAGIAALDDARCYDADVLDHITPVRSDAPRLSLRDRTDITEARCLINEAIPLLQRALRLHREVEARYEGPA